MRDGPTRILVFTIAAFCLLAAGAVSATAESTEMTATQADHIDECAAEPPEDFADPDGNTSDVIGWVEGYWYNEPLDIDADDGLSEEELDALAARSAARFEAMRCLTADGLPPVEIQTREEFQDELGEQFEDVTEAERNFDNAQLQTMLTVGTDRDSIEVREANRGETVGGFYDFESNRIVVVSDSPDSLLIDEEILAHELGHAIQDQQFNLSQYDRPTQDRDAGVLGLIEGDVHLIEQRYLDACENDEWDEPCIQQDLDEMPDDIDLPSWGLYFMDFQPYSDGPSFVEHVYETSGEEWTAVDELYENPPQSSTETIYPERYDEFEPETLEIDDQSAEHWERIPIEDGPDHNEIGQAGITGMLMASGYETSDPVINPLTFLNIDEDGDPDEFNPLNYDQPETDGWMGDRLYTYENDDELAAVWKLAWDDTENAAEFETAYEQLAQARGGDQHDEFANVYTFEDTDEWEMAAALEVRDDRLWIVTAPTVEELQSVHEDIELLEGETGESDGADDTDDSDRADDTDAGETDDDRAGEADDTDDDTDTDDDGAGFGLVVAIVGLVAVAVVGRRMRA